MKNLSPFQIVLLVVSGIIIVVGVLIFAFSKSQTGEQAGTVVVWGTIPAEDFTVLTDYLQNEEKIEQIVDYKYIEPARFDVEFTNALAEGVGPDLIMVTDDRLVRHEKKLFQISYEFYPERLYKDTFIEAGEIFTDERGVFAFPFLVDPMVMYWNRAYFTEKGLSQPPKFWDELLTMTPKLVETEPDLSIKRSAVAMGEYSNINNAKALVTTLFMQAGNNVITRNKTNEPGMPLFNVILDQKLDYAVSPSQAAMNFYTQFANPSRTVYSWNRSMPTSLDAFIAGDVAMYFGYASEFQSVRQKNPNLNFDVAVIPQSRTGIRATYGKVLALGIPKSTPNVERAFALIRTMTSANVNAYYSDSVFLPPVRRDLLSENPTNAFMQTFNESALIAKNVYDFNPEETNQIFQRMVESIVSGRMTTSEAILRANGEIDLLRP
jgi:ABC-type glycerol-3-phosphate transport system substrate-binding protein